MSKIKILAGGLLAFWSIASAQNVLVAGHVQRVMLVPSGGEECPSACPTAASKNPDGSQRVCITNDGGCQVMELKVDHDYRGMSQGQIRQFRSRIGEWGPSFSATDKQILVSEEAGRVSWSPITTMDGKVYIDPKRVRSIEGIPTSQNGEHELVPLDEVLARSGLAR